MNRNRHELSILLPGLIALALWGAPATRADEAAPAPRPAATKAAAETVVDVNAASEQDLVRVPGIGQSLARRIVQFRDKNGPYQRVEDLLKVQGIGEKSLQKLRPYLTTGKSR